LAFSVAGGDTASALAVGCPVVIKGHPAHPGTCELAGQAVMQAVRKNRIPPGAFSLLQAENTGVGAALVQHQLIKAVAFTGSFTGGRALFGLACSRPEPIPVYAEMSSVNPVFFLSQIIDNKGTLLAAELAESLTLGVGQFCTAPGLIVVVKGAATDTFLHELEACLAATPPGIMLHDGIKRNFLSKLKKLSSVDGVELCDRPRPLLDGCLVSAELLRTDAKTLLGNPAIAEEVFGPSAIVVACDSRGEMLDVAESLQGQLTASVHGTNRELNQFRDLLVLLERKAGRLIMNGFPTGVEVCAAMHHGGPYPATTDSRSTSVGTDAMKRFLRPVCYQNYPQEFLPEPLRTQAQFRS
jgi:NADP-dependent aldehyde dehydrogenase